MSELNPKYCDINWVKDRLLINREDNSYDNALNQAVEEASRLVDMFLRAYTEVPLNVENFIEDFESGQLRWEYDGDVWVTNAIAHSGIYSCYIGLVSYIKKTFNRKIVKDVKLEFYSYTTAYWGGRCKVTITYTDDTVQEYEVNMRDQWEQQSFLLQHDKTLDYIEISNIGWTDFFIDDITINFGFCPYEIQQITADFATSIFLRRMMPREVNLRGALQPDQINQIDASGWFALGLRKLEQYIKSKYVIQDKPLTTTLYNPDIYRELFERGLITGAEFREYTGKEVVIKDVRETYEYKRQKMFKVVSGVEDSDKYEVND